MTMLIQFSRQACLRLTFATAVLVHFGVNFSNASDGVSAFSATNSLDFEILAFPDIKADQYRPDIAAHVVNVLVASGKDAAYSAIDKQIRINRYSITNRAFQSYHVHNEKLCHIMRLLFTPTNSGAPLRPPRLGLSASLPVLSMNQAEWPCLPFVVTNGIPLAVSLGYVGTGIAEDAQDYFTYCKASGMFRVEPLSEATFVTGSNSLKGVFASKAWGALRWRDNEYGFSYDLDKTNIENRLMLQLGKLR